MSFKHLLSLFAGITLLAVSCGEDPAEPPQIEVAAPKLVSTQPEKGVDAEIKNGECTVELTFDQSVICPQAKRSEISVSPSTANISGIKALDRKVSISLNNLDYSSEYKIIIPKGCVTGYKDNVAEALEFSFTTAEDPRQGMVSDPDRSLSNPSPSANAKKLYESLLSIYGKHSLSGTMGGTAWETSCADYIYNQTGIYPAIVGFDYIFNNWPPKYWDACPDYNDISVIRDAWKKGNVIQIGWHWCMPTAEGITDPNKYNYSNAVKAERAVTEGTWENAEMKKQVAQIASFLQLLQKEDIPVLWRPLHEAAGDYKWGAWFWWGNGGSEVCKKLWRYMYDCFTNEYGLNNLIWVWTVQTSYEGKPADVSYLKDWYPGDDCVDIVGADLYLSKGVSSVDQFNLVNLSVKGKKMVTMSEFGNLPNLDDCYENGALWLYYMNWCAFDENGKPALYSKNSDGTYSWNNSVQEWKTILQNTLTYNRGDLK